jgi:hypothetical protein
VHPPPRQILEIWWPGRGILCVPISEILALGALNLALRVLNLAIRVLNLGPGTRYYIGTTPLCIKNFPRQKSPPRQKPPPPAKFWALARLNLVAGAPTPTSLVNSALGHLGDYGLNLF